MSQRTQPVLPRRPRKQYTLLLAFCWVAGLICGAAVYHYAADSLSVLMHRFVYQKTSAIRFFPLLPFLLSAFASVLTIPSLLFGICFGKAFLFAFCSLGILHSCGYSGWICRFFVLFCDLAAIPVLYLYWIRCCSAFSVTKSSIGREVLMILAVMGIWSFDICIISPVWACLIDF